jgi:DNA-binding NtrC family response regulator
MTATTIKLEILKARLVAMGFSMDSTSDTTSKHIHFWRKNPEISLTIPAQTGCSIGIKLLCRILHDARLLAIESILPRTSGPTSASSEPGSEFGLTVMQQMERGKIVEMLSETGQNKLETAKRLGIGRQTLYNKLKLYRIND